jgi:hypothetical protein
VVPPAGLVRAAVGVGYGGVRALSMDDGLTWTVTGESAPNGGDDKNLLRAVAYGASLWVAGGWDKWFTSPDGRTWTERPHGFGIIQGMAFGNAYFIASDINANIYKSSDGLAWMRIAKAGTGTHTRVLFGAGKFAAFGDNKTVETSGDGVTWTRLDGFSSVAYCGGDAWRTREACYGREDAVWREGVALRAVWKGQIFRSTDLAKWTRVFNYPQNAFDHIAFGYAPGK